MPPSDRRTPLLATIAYVAAALSMTWPLAAGLSRDLPSDLGDPVLNCFILGRNADRLQRALGGEAGALSGFWDAAIFHPEPLTLAYSEHLLPQTLQILPFFALSRNVILSYNLVFLSSFVLSALGAFLLVRELTSDRAAAFLAGLAYGFALYRAEQLSHVQVLSSQWMPFVLLLLRRHFDSRRARLLAWAVLALAVQNLSCGYYLLFFSPFAALYALWEMRRRGLLREARAWALMALAAAAVAALTVPFLLPYRELRARGGLLRERWEVEAFSADVYGYATAPDSLRLWGERLQVFARPEAQLFPGFVPILLAAAGLVSAVARAWPRLGAPLEPGPRRAAALSLALLAFLAALALAVILAGAGELVSARVPLLRLRTAARPALLLLASLGGLLLVSRRARALARAAAGSSPGFFVAAAALAFWLSLGPSPRALGRALPLPGLYAALYEHVPGFDGVRVPARYGMLFALFLAVLAGWGAAELRRRRPHPAWPALACAAFLAEAGVAPLVLNDVWAEPGLRRPPPRLLVGSRTPAIYGEVARLPEGAVIAELPFGSEPWELRYMIAALEHRHRLLNGFSGVLPRSYRERRGALRAVLREPERAWQALRASGATHALVHEDAWALPRKGRRVSRWLDERGARRIAADGGGVLFALPGP